MVPERQEFPEEDHHFEQKLTFPKGLNFMNSDSFQFYFQNN